MSTKKEKLIAFWEYDRYPYCLWGEIDNKGREDDFWIKQGRHYASTYQSYVKAFLILGESEAEKIITELKKLKVNKDNEENRISKHYNEQLKLIIPDLPAIKYFKK